jgi:hypothetical protein
MADDKKPAETPETPAKPAENNPPTAADTAAGGKTAREVQLEKRLATLEDDHNSVKGQLKDAMEFITAAKKVPSGRNPKKSVVDDINDFLGFGDSEAA